LYQLASLGWCQRTTRIGSEQELRVVPPQYCSYSNNFQASLWVLFASIQIFSCNMTIQGLVLWSMREMVEWTDELKVTANLVWISEAEIFLVHSAASINGTMSIVTGSFTNLKDRSFFRYENNNSVSNCEGNNSNTYWGTRNWKREAFC
jgi:hypothetical protein